MQRWQQAVDSANQALALELCKNLSTSDVVRKRPEEAQPIDQQLLFKTVERRATALKELGRYREAVQVSRGGEGCLGDMPYSGSLLMALCYVMLQGSSCNFCTEQHEQENCVDVPSM